MKKLASAVVAAGIAASAPSQSLISSDYWVDTVATGLSFPTNLAFVSQVTFLVLEKTTGKVKVFTNGTFAGVALDLAVANQGERGLLGILLDPSFATNHYIYLYYSKAANDGGTWIQNELDRFIWDGSTLTFDATLFTMTPDPSQNNAVYHSGGYLKLGPDNKIYLQAGDFDRGQFGNNRIEQNTGSTAVARSGCIFRLNLDGSVPADNPFTFYPDDSIKKAFVYGFRNGFGMNFDPVTNNLWYTANGPEVYDEINIAFSGMNDGWRLLMGPEYRHAAYSGNNFGNYSISDLVMLPGAAYRDPVFSWLGPIGVTSIYFPNSDKWSASEQNSIIVGDVNNGQLYKFQINTARNGLVLTPDTQDLVADTSQERDEFLFGTGWGTTTVMETGPDGYAYVVNYGGSISRIRPVNEIVHPTSFTLNRGIVLAGGLNELAISDDQRMILRPGVVLSSSESPIQLVLNAVSPYATPSNLRFTIESRANVANIQQSVSLYNYWTSSYEQIDARTLTVSDTTMAVDIGGNPLRFINSTTRAMSALIKYKAVGPVPTYPWQAQIDYLVWRSDRQ